MRVLVAAALAVTFQTQGPSSRATLAFQNAKVRVYRTDAGMLTGVPHGPGVVVRLDDGPAGNAGTSIWLDDAAVPLRAGAGSGPIAIVQPLATGQPPAPPPASGSKPGEAPFTGMTFKTLFENARVTVIRARMEVGAREAFHTHASDTIVVHLSGGEIEDTVSDKATVNRWNKGDIEFEARGSSHSARNIGHPVDVVLVALKP